jgi:hypothetical protein
MTTVVDEEFAKIPEDFVGLIGWRIENFKPVLQQVLGKFHTGDSYLILHAYRVGTSKRIIRDIFFWLGSTSTQDERGAAAIKAIELDDYFGGTPVQHREVQYHETEAFLRLFDKTGGIEYLDGGVPSAFRKVNTEKTVNMYMVKGKKNVMIVQVAPMRASLCHNNCYIIHTQGQFYLWIGKNASMLEKNKAASALDIMKSRDPKAKVERIEGEESEGLNALIGSEGEIKETDISDEEFEATFKKAIYDKDGKIIAEGKNVAKNLLPSDQISFVLYGPKIFAHIGKSAPKEAKRTAITDAVKLIGKLGLPDYTNIEVLLEGSEDDDFDFAFH